MKNEEIARHLEEHQSNLRKVSGVKTLADVIGQSDYAAMPKYDSPDYVHYLNSRTSQAAAAVFASKSPPIDSSQPSSTAKIATGFGESRKEAAKEDKKVEAKPTTSNRRRNSATTRDNGGRSKRQRYHRPISSSSQHRQPKLLLRLPVCRVVETESAEDILRGTLSSSGTQLCADTEFPAAEVLLNEPTFQKSYIATIATGRGCNEKCSVPMGHQNPNSLPPQINHNNVYSVAPPMDPQPNPPPPPMNYHQPHPPSSPMNHPQSHPPSSPMNHPQSQPPSSPMNHHQSRPPPPPIYHHQPHSSPPPTNQHLMNQRRYGVLLWGATGTTCSMTTSVASCNQSDDKLVATTNTFNALSNTINDSDWTTWATIIVTPF